MDQSPGRAAILTPSDDDERQQLIEQRRRWIREMLGVYGREPSVCIKAAQESAWLKVIYEQDAARLSAEWDREWGAQRLLLPLSIAPFAAVVVADNLSTLKVVLLAGASLALAITNELIVRRYQVFTTAVQVWLTAIRLEVGLQGDYERPKSPPTARMTSVRTSMVYLIAFAWIGLIAAVESGAV